MAVITTNPAVQARSMPRAGSTRSMPSTQRSVVSSSYQAGAGQTLETPRQAHNPILTSAGGINRGRTSTAVAALLTAATMLESAGCVHSGGPQPSGGEAEGSIGLTIVFGIIVGITMLSGAVRIANWYKRYRERPPAPPIEYESQLEDPRDPAEYGDDLRTLTGRSFLPFIILDVRRFVRGEKWDDLAEAINFANKRWPARKVSTLQWALSHYASPDVPSSLFAQAARMRASRKGTAFPLTSLMKEKQWDVIETLFDEVDGAGDAAMTSMFMEIIIGYDDSLSKRSEESARVPATIIEKMVLSCATKRHRANALDVLLSREEWDIAADLLRHEDVRSDDRLLTTLVKRIKSWYAKVPPSLAGIAVRSDAKESVRLSLMQQLVESSSSLDFRGDAAKEALQEVKHILRFMHEERSLKEAAAFAEEVTRYARTHGFNFEVEERAKAIVDEYEPHRPRGWRRLFGRG